MISPSRPSPHQFAQAAVAGLEPLVESRRVPHPVFTAGGDHRLGIRQGSRHRFFAEDVLARARSRFHDGPVQVIGRGDVNGFQPRRRQEVVQVRVPGRLGVVPARDACRADGSGSQTATRRASTGPIIAGAT